MKEISSKNKLLVVSVIAIFLSTSFFMAYDTESCDAAITTPTITQVNDSPNFVVSLWKLNQYNSVNGVYTVGDNRVDSFSSSWVGTQIPGIAISARGGSVKNGDTNIHAVKNTNGTYSYFFKLSGTPTKTGTYEVKNQLLPPIIPGGLSFTFNIITSYESYSNIAQSSKGEYKVSISSAMEFIGANWTASNRWAFEYNLAGTGHAEGYYGAIRNAMIKIEATKNLSRMSLYTGNFPRDIGSVPASNDNTNYLGIAMGAVGLALNVNTYVSTIWSALSFVLALSSMYNSGNTSYWSVVREWKWSTDIKDTCQFIHFIVYLDPNQEAEFSYEYSVLGPRYEGLSVGKHYKTIKAGPSGGGSSINMNPTQMTIAEREECGIETIPRANLLTRATELNISETTLREWLESDEDVFYYTNNFVEYETSQPEKTELKRSSLTKDLLSDELSAQINRNRMIIGGGFSISGVCGTDDSKETINKYTVRLKYLLGIQKRLEAIHEKDIIELNIIFDSYLNTLDADAAYTGRIK